MASAQDDLVRLATEGVGEALSGTGLASRVAQYGGKAASLALSGATPEGEGRDAYFRRIDLSVKEPRGGDTLEILLDTKLAKEPELFYGPFLQLGTYLDIENPLLRLGLDIVADPLTWVPVDLGLGKLNRAGRLGELLSSVTHGGRLAMTPEKALTRVGQTLETFGKIAGNPELRQQVIGASKKLTGGEFKRLLNGIKAADVPPGVKEMIDTLGRNRKAFGDLLRLAGNEKTAQRAIQGGDLLQKTFRSQLAAGQRTIIEFHKPFTMTKAWLGTGYKDHVLWRPTFPALFMPESAASRLSGEATAQVARQLAPEFDLSAAFLPDTGKTFDVTVDHVDSAFTTLEALMAPSGPGMTLGEEVSQASALKYYQTYFDPSAKPNFVKTNKFQRFHHEYTQTFLEHRAAQGAAASGAREAAFARARASAEGALRSIAPDTMSADEVDAFIAERVSGLEIWQRGTTPAEIVNDPGGWGLGLESAHKAMRKQVANLGVTMDEMFRKNFAKRGEREAMQEFYGHMVSHPTLFTVDASGRAVLKRVGDVAEEAPLLDNFLKAHPDVAEFVTKEGVPADITQMAGRNIAYYEAMGAQQFAHEFTIPDFIGNYIPRRGRFTKAGREKFKRQIGEARAAVEADLLVNPSAELEREIDAVLREVVDREGKASHEKVRVLTEKMLAAWERNGWFVRETDPVKILTEYADAAAKSKLHNQMFTDLPELVGRISPMEEEKFVKGHGITAEDFAGLVGKRRITYRKPKNTTGWEELRLSKRYGAPTKDEVAEFANLSKSETREALRLKVADDLGGKSEVGGVKVISKEYADIAPSGGKVYATQQDLGEITYASAADLSKKLGLGGKTAIYHVTDAGDAIRSDGFIRALDEESVSFFASKEIAEEFLGAQKLKDPSGSWEMLSVQIKNVAATGAGVERGASSRYGREVFVYGDVPLSVKPGAKSEPILLDSGWIRADSYPKRIKNIPEVRAAVKRELAKREKDLEARIGKRLSNLSSGRLTRKGELAERRERVPASIWVAKPYAQEVTAAFRFFGREGLSSGQGWRWFDVLNGRLKSLVLAVDAFHGNVLTAASMIANPGKMAEVLRLRPELFNGGLAAARLARTRFLPRTATGALVGAAGAAGLGAEDPEAIAAGGLAGALWSNAFTAALRNGVLARKMALTPGVGKVQAYAGLVWNGLPNDRSIGLIGRGLKSMAESLRKAGAPGAAISPIEGVQHVDEMFQETLWGVMHNGAKEVYFAARFAEAEEKLLKAGKLGKDVLNGIDQELLKASREIMASADTFFGGQNMGRLFVHPQAQQFLRRSLLSHDWTSARLLGGANMMLNMTAPSVLAASAAGGTIYELAANGFDIGEVSGTGTAGGAAVGVVLQRWAQRVNARMVTKGDILAREARKLYGAAILGGYFMGNLLNYAFNGRWMFENDHGDELKIAMPDGSRITYGKAYKEIFEFAGADPHYGVPVQARVASKLSVPIKLGIEVMTNRSWNGPIVQADANIFEKAGSAVKWAATSVTPIFATGPVREASALVGGSRTGGQAATIAVLRGVGLGVTPPRRTQETLNPALQQATGGLPFIRDNPLDSLVTSQRNLR